MERDEIYLLPAEAAKVLGVNPQNLRSQAQDDPAKLGFPVIVIGNRTLIPRKPFFAYLGIANEAQ